MSEYVDKSAIRHAATIIVLRETSAGHAVLMGQRGQGAAFMPNKFVFPGGAVDQADHLDWHPTTADATTLRRLHDGASSALARALLNAGIRELWEETGLAIADGGDPTADIPNDWCAFVRDWGTPCHGALQYFFRAITPPGRPRRFDARFFVAQAVDVSGDLDDFSTASDELRHLQWIGLKEARELPLPFVTEIVLAELDDLIANPDPQRPVPFFDNSTDQSQFRMIT